MVVVIGGINKKKIAELVALINILTHVKPVFHMIVNYCLLVCFYLPCVLINQRVAKTEKLAIADGRTIFLAMPLAIPVVSRWQDYLWPCH